MNPELKPQLDEPTDQPEIEGDLRRIFNASLDFVRAQPGYKESEEDNSATQALRYNPFITIGVATSAQEITFLVNERLENRSTAYRLTKDLRLSFAPNGSDNDFYKQTTAGTLHHLPTLGNIIKDLQKPPLRIRGIWTTAFYRMGIARAEIDVETHTYDPAAFARSRLPTLRQLVNSTHGTSVKYLELKALMVRGYMGEQVPPFVIKTPSKSSYVNSYVG